MVSSNVQEDTFPLLNRVTLQGALVRDAEIKTTQTNKSVAEFLIAVNKRLRPLKPDAPTCDFFRCRAWGANAEYVGTYGTKGRRLTLEGRLESRRFIDASNVQRELIEIVCDNIYMDESSERSQGQDRSA